jgi:hypothetical protein
MKRVRLFMAILFFAMIAPSRLKSEPATRAAQLDPVRIHCGANKPRFGISGEKVALAYSWGATGSAATKGTFVDSIASWKTLVRGGYYGRYAPSLNPATQNS